MKTLILNGSPRKNGHTVALIDEIKSVLKGEIKIIDAYKVNVSACKDCRYCFTKKGCSIKDDMQEIYSDIEKCDAVVVATPMHFGTFSAPLFTICTRLQSYWPAKNNVREEQDDIKPKYGALIVTTGGKWVNMELLIEGTADFFFHYTNAEQIGSAYAYYTDTNPAKDNIKAIEQTRYLGQRLNELCYRE
ncbi:Flavin reductase [[Clostridium] ultunense Esp]|uniref:Flavin reductase n=1 Tax=[Clostridium] ultunense Esp TaxID=1288971 RepID=M1ZHP3_9FIRM|nr:flavodoxin family protein [Schnuerera ultunensis]CCQ93397.1 Flavin reductase [[Clostridium] ultunense Esp]SHD75948.1 Flavin reductase [[Clostridium] ultunense Esp]